MENILTRKLTVEEQAKILNEAIGVQIIHQTLDVVVALDKHDGNQYVFNVSDFDITTLRGVFKYAEYRANIKGRAEGKRQAMSKIRRKLRRN